MLLRETEEGRLCRRRQMEDREWLEAGLPKVSWLEAELQALARPTILLVEDEDDIRDLLVTLMDLAGFADPTVPNG